MKISNGICLLSALLLLFCFVSSCSKAEIAPDQRAKITAELDSLFLTEYDAERFSGTVAIGNQEQLIYNKAWGIADRRFNVPMETGFRFDIASVNKSMVGALVMMAVNEKKLALSDRLTDLLSGFNYSGSFDESITVHQMLTHTSGLADYNGIDSELSADNFRAFKRLHFTNTEYVDFISRLKPAGMPGDRFHYSNFAYHLLCIIIEKTYGTDFGEVLQSKIAGPLAMEQTYSTTDNNKLKEKSVTAYQFENSKWIENGFIDLTIGRRVFSTAENLYKWGRAMSDTTFLPAASLNQIKSNHLENISQDMSYGYGWVVYKYGDSFEMGSLPTQLPYIIHGGSTEGFKSIVVNINGGEWIIAVLANSGDQANEMRLAQRVTEILMSNTHTDR